MSFSKKWNGLIRSLYDNFTTWNACLMLLGVMLGQTTKFSQLSHDCETHAGLVTFLLQRGSIFLFCPLACATGPGQLLSMWYYIDTSSCFYWSGRYIHTSDKVDSKLGWYMSGLKNVTSLGYRAPIIVFMRRYRLLLRSIEHHFLIFPSRLSVMWSYCIRRHFFRSVISNLPKHLVKQRWTC